MPTIKFVKKGRGRLCKGGPDEDHHTLEKNKPYIMIKGWNATGWGQMCMCLKHAKEFIEQAKAVEKQIVEPVKSNEIDKSIVFGQEQK